MGQGMMGRLMTERRTDGQREDDGTHVTHGVRGRNFLPLLYVMPLSCRMSCEAPDCCHYTCLETHFCHSECTATIFIWYYS